jgi:hypothetical protein
VVRRTDGDIKAEVVDRLDLNEHTRDHRLKVDVDQHVVVLGGRVASALAKRAAGDEAWDTPGVVDVSNQIVVQRPGGETTPDDDATLRPVPIGRTRWAIAEGYIPEESTGPEPEMTSHETACILNTTDREAHVHITLYFAGAGRPVPRDRSPTPDRARALQRPAGPRAGAARRRHASVLESDVPVVVQHTRLDPRQAENALLTTTTVAAKD